MIPQRVVGGGRSHSNPQGTSLPTGSRRAQARGLRCYNPLGPRSVLHERLSRVLNLFETV